MSTKRVQASQKVFQSLLQADRDKVDVSEVQRKFNPKRHPDVLLKKKSEDDVAYDFLDTLEVFVASG